MHEVLGMSNPRPSAVNKEQGDGVKSTLALRKSIGTLIQPYNCVVILKAIWYFDKDKINYARQEHTSQLYMDRTPVLQINSSAKVQAPCNVRYT